MPVTDVSAHSGRRLVLALAVAALALSLVTPAGALAKKPPVTPPHAVNVQLLAINDFHGNLEPPTGSSGRVGSAANDQACTDAPDCDLAGGLAFLADDVKDLEATNPGNTLVVAAGDNIGGTPLISAAFHDEPTIEALNLIGMDVSAVGNHEFDEGVDELLRIQNGGCHPTDGCDTGHTYQGADFQFLAANVVYKDTGEPIFPASTVKTVDGVKVGFVGLTLKGTNLIVSPAGIQDVNFLDEASTINAAAADLRSQGAKTSSCSSTRAARSQWGLLQARSTRAPACRARSSTSSATSRPPSTWWSAVTRIPRTTACCRTAKGSCPGQQRVVVRPPGDRYRYEDQLAERPADVHLGRQQDRLPRRSGCRGGDPRVRLSDAGCADCQRGRRQHHRQHHSHGRC